MRPDPGRPVLLKAEYQLRGPSLADGLFAYDIGPNSLLFLTTQSEIPLILDGDRIYMATRYFACLLLILLPRSVMAGAQEPVKPKLTPRIITATRQVTIFTGLEKQMLLAVQKKDKPALQAMLTDDFEIAMPDADPLESDDWLDSVMASDFILKSFAVRQMSVVDLENAALVKFERVQQATYKGNAESGESFVVDLWKKSGDSWKLANRYVAKAGGISENVKTPAKPSGKE